MNMKDFFKPELLKPFPPENSINDYFDNNTHGLPTFKPDNRPLIEKVKMPISAADFGYESPLKIIREELENIGRKQAAELDKQTLEAVLRVGIQVDKEELIKALSYDRDQYSKGFNDGLASSEKKTEVYCTEGMCKFLKGGICTKDEIHLIHDECRSFESEDQE